MPRVVTVLLCNERTAPLLARAATAGGYANQVLRESPDGFIRSAMPVWIRNGLSIAEWGAVQFRLLVLQHETRKQMVMLLRPGAEGQPDDVFVALPDDELATRFPQFTVIAEADIPDGVTLLVGADTGFAERFPEVALKLRGMPG